MFHDPKAYKFNVITVMEKIAAHFAGNKIPSMNMKIKIFNRKKKDILWQAIREIDANMNIVNTKFTKHNL